jgi:hypothetical protein
VVVAPYGLVSGYQNFGGTYCFHLQDISRSYVRELSHWLAVIDFQISLSSEERTKHFKVKLHPKVFPVFLDVRRMSWRKS